MNHPDLTTTVLNGLHTAHRREVLISGHQRLTGAHVLALVAGAAQTLTADGIRPGDTIACQYGPQPESLLTCLTAAVLGCPLLYLWPSITDTLAHQTTQALNITTTLTPPQQTALHTHPATEPPTPAHRHPDDITAITFTSGTTGQRKPITYTARAQAAHLAVMRAVHGHTPARLLAPTHLEYTRVLHQLWAWAGGGTVLIPTDHDDLADTARRERATHLIAGRPATLYPLAEQLATAPPAHLTTITYGGAAPTPTRTAQAVTTLGTRLVQTYGTNEAGCLTALTRHDHRTPRLLASAGRAVPGVELHIRDQDGTAVHPGDVGEVWARSPQSTHGYLGDPHRTARLTHNGWIRTGDLGRLDPDGYLFLLDRVEDRLADGIYSHPIEHLLSGDPTVLEAAVFGDGSRHAGAIVAKPGADVNLENLRDLIAHTLGPHHRPERLWLVDRLPRTPGGKPDKAALRARRPITDP
ncbi:fatty acid--CoA ligase family protein [Nonomuraea longicatena]|uniref:Uncharacterized protein n=1 Tax=Nonomuraea longicatena TaxID=83682 RepID=A0ABP4AL13_9ACTN